MAKVKTDFKKLASLINSSNKQRIYREVSKVYKGEVINSIRKGISPVRGFGRFQRYSESYILQLKNLLAFRVINGKVVPFVALSNKELKTFRASKSARKSNTNIRNKIKELNSGLKGKKQRPVNLNVTGKLWKSIFTKIAGSKLAIGFNNELADIHNRLGAGKSKIVRLILPTNPGERFNITI